MCVHLFDHTEGGEERGALCIVGIWGRAICIWFGETEQKERVSRPCFYDHLVRCWGIRDGCSSNIRTSRVVRLLTCFSSLLLRVIDRGVDMY